MAEIKQGDFIFQYSPFSNLVKIEIKEVTKSHLVLGSFNGKIKLPFVDGTKAVGAPTWSNTSYYNYSEELEVKYKKQQALLEISKIDFTKLQQSQLDNILNISNETPN